jgi:hypothetical protein
MVVFRTAQRDSIHGTPTLEKTNSTPAVHCNGNLEVVVKDGAPEPFPANLRDIISPLGSRNDIQPLA